MSDQTSPFRSARPGDPRQERAVRIRAMAWIAALFAAIVTGCGRNPSGSRQPIVLHSHVQRAALTGSEGTSTTAASRSAEQIVAAIELATDYLIAHHQADGRFTYVSRPLPPNVAGQPHDPNAARYNLLRHAGAIYALCQRHQWRNDARIPAVVQKAAGFLSETVAAVPDQPNVLAIWTTRELTGDDVPRHAKLGGTGLGLVALLSVEALAPGTVSADTLRGLGEFLLFMRQSDGSFHSRYVPETGGYDENWTSLYYPGEAALGLVQLYRWDGDRRWYDAALGSLLYLAETRDGQLSIPVDHWALLATEQLLAIEAITPLDADRRKLIRHAQQICRVIMNERNQSHAILRGCFGADGRTTPTATRVEGLTATLNFLPADLTELSAEIKDACADSVDFLISAQYPVGAHRGGMPQSIGRIANPLTASAKRLNESAADIRVDYVQHALSAWLQWLPQTERSN